MNTIATPWAAFPRGDATVATDLLAQILTMTAEAWVVVEPVPDEQRRGMFRKAKGSPYSATISPYADDEEPHAIAYVTFPKGAVFSDRGLALPSWAVLDDEAKDDATLRMPIATPPGDMIALAIAALDSCSDAPLGDAWRACIGDTYVGKPGY